MTNLVEESSSSSATDVFSLGKDIKQSERYWTADAVSNLIQWLQYCQSVTGRRMGSSPSSNGCVFCGNSTVNATIP
eukprot:626755-Prorocentrum_minimum.AAC.1